MPADEKMPTDPRGPRACSARAWRDVCAQGVGVCMLVHITTSNQTSLHAEQEAQVPDSAENSQSELLKEPPSDIATRD